MKEICHYLRLVIKRYDAAHLTFMLIVIVFIGRGLLGFDVDRYLVLMLTFILLAIVFKFFVIDFIVRSYNEYKRSPSKKRV